MGVFKKAGKFLDSKVDEAKNVAKSVKDKVATKYNIEHPNGVTESMTLEEVFTTLEKDFNISIKEVK